MKFYDKITGNDIRRACQEFDVRSDKLPLDYQIAWKEIQSSLWDYSNFSGREPSPYFGWDSGTARGICTGWNPNRSNH